MIYVPGGAGLEGTRFYHTTQNSMLFKTNELFIFKIFHLIFLYYSWTQVAEIVKSKTAYKRTSVVQNLQRIHTYLCGIFNKAFSHQISIPELCTDHVIYWPPTPFSIKCVSVTGILFPSHFGFNSYSVEALCQHLCSTYYEGLCWQGWSSGWNWVPDSNIGPWPKQNEWHATPGVLATISELSINFSVISEQLVSFSFPYMPINSWRTDTQGLEELNKIMFKFLLNSKYS